MGRYVALAATASVLLSGGCMGTKVRPEAVSFDHPDEVIQGEGFMVLADRREFAVMAFLNATGYDQKAQGQQMHPVRVRVRQLVAANLAEHPHKVKAWQRYRKGLVRKYMETYNYQDYVLSLSTDYPFRRIRPDEELNYWYIGWILGDLPDVLNDFWATAKLDEVWSEVKSDYIAELRKYDFERMRRQMDFLWSYLRMPRQDTLTLVNVPNLLECHFHAIGARYENFYYTVESPGSHSYGLNIHEYLHSIVNDLVKANFGAQKAKLLKYYKAGKDGPLCKSYQYPVGFTWECLVRALDHRLRALSSTDRLALNRAEDQVAQLSTAGLTLTQPFYQLLPEFEQSGKPFDQFLPTLLERLAEYR